jgi:putative SOS response-associated peptidase YedK
VAGLVLHWATGPKPSAFFNARAETAPEKPAFRDLFRFRRCLDVAGGFYEWEHRGGRKQPYYFASAGGGPLVLAGLWDRWVGPARAVEGVAVLTIPANDLVRPLHDRMPAVVAPEDFALWLDPRERDPVKLLPLLRPCPAERVRRWPVDRRVNSVRAVDDRSAKRTATTLVPPGTHVTVGVD